MCKLEAKWLKPTLYGADYDMDRQTDRQRDGRPTNAIIIAVRRNTAWDARNVYLNIMYLNISHRMCNLVAKSLTTSYGADCDMDRQTDGRTNAIIMV